MTPPKVQPSRNEETFWRSDAVEKVTGSARYTSDMALAGMGYAAIFRSEHAHGIIERLDLSRARALDGVVCVVSGDDLKDLDPFIGEWVLDQPFLARERVRFAGEPVAAVVAETPMLAEYACTLIELDVRELPVLGSAMESILDGDTLIHPERDPVDDTHHNVCFKASFEAGDVDEAMSRAAHVHEATYTFPAVFHYTMEPFSSVARWSRQRLEVWSGTQQPFKVRDDLARIFGLQQSNVRVQVPFVGGGYGAKGQCRYEPLVSLLALRAGRPVKLVVSVEESMRTVSRHAATIRMKTAVDDDGLIIAREAFTVFDTGAYADKGPRVARKGAYRAIGPYRIPHSRSVALAVYSNRVPAGAFRGFSTPQVIWAGESAIDELARELGLDPVEFRLRNLREKGEPFFADDAPLDADLRGGFTATVAKIPSLAREHGEPDEGSDARTPGILRGAAAAIGVKDGGGGPAHTEAEVRLYPDGSIEVVAAAVELGQGVQSVLANIAAEVLGTPPGRIRVRLPDTADAPYDRGTGASRSTIGVGSAVQAAAQTLRRDINRIAKARFDAGKAAVELLEQDVLVGDRHVPYTEFIAADRGISPADAGPMVARGVHNVRSGGSSLGHSCPFYEVSHAAAAVSVDPETGFLDIDDVAIASDVGWAINREACLGQDEGAMMMGLGHTLFEELQYERGQLVNGTLVEYRLPRTTDLPGHVDSFLIENQDGPGPYGSKGAGEGGILAIAAAIGNAFAVATGVRIRELPLTPERVWRALREGSEG